MRLMAIGLLGLALTACTPEPQTGTEARASVAATHEAHIAPMGFLFDLYSHYDGKQDIFPMAEAAPLYFDAELVALIREDDRLRGNEIGALDHDPICQCQDYERLHVSLKVETATPSTARVTAYLTEKGEWPPRQVVYDLVRSSGEWRIHDLSSAGMPSLRALLIRSNADLAGVAASSAG